MDSKHEKKESTVQGRDTPVPVRGLSGRAGSPGPSACDRSALPVATQAGSGYTATGTKGSKGKSQGANLNETVFRFRERVNSLPENTSEVESALALGGMKRKGRDSLTEGEAQEINTSYTSLVWDEEAQRSVKKPKDSEWMDRGRRLSFTCTGRLRDKVSALVQRVDSELRTMRKIVKENKNTKVELKDGVERLSSMVSQLATKEVYDALKGVEEERQTIVLDDSAETGRLGTQENPVREELARRLAKAEEEIRKLRTKNDSLTREMEELRGHKEQVTDQMLDNKTSYEEFVQLETMEWPNKLYRSAFFAAGSPLVSKANTDHLVVYEEGKYQKGTEGLKKAFEDRFPELRESEEEAGVVKICTRVPTRDGGETVSERWLVRVEAGDEDSIWFNSLSRAKTILCNGGRKKVAVYPPGSDTKGSKTRKMLEYIFRVSDIKCFLHIKTGQEERVNKEEEIRPRVKRPDALVLSQEGKTYSDLLKVVRDRIKPDSAAAKAVRTIREARDGKRMVIVLDKEGGHAVEQLKGEIGKMESVRIMDNARREEDVVFIQGIDELSTKEDAVNAVCRETGLAREQVTTGDLRKGFGGNRSVMVRLPREKVADLCKKGKLRIGLNWCLVRERVEVFRCFRCWKYGHLARECREDGDDSKLCRKCGGVGHIAANCSHRDWCLTCKVEGHTTGSGACPEFRKAVSRERRARNRRRGY